MQSSKRVRGTPDNNEQDQNGDVHKKVLDQVVTDQFAAYHGDSCETLPALPENSVHFQICSPPFSDLFCYSHSDRDLGNSRGDDQFFQHYKFIVEEQFRVAMPGRLCAIHVMNLPTSKTRNGYIGIRDFRGDCIRLFQSCGWIYHSEVCIWKNPVTAMQRTKALGLLHKQLRKDSCMSRQGIADYLVVFRKPGENPEPVSHTHDSFPVSMWQRYASPVWAMAGEVEADGFHFMDDTRGDDTEESAGGINQSNTLQGRSAREDDDEKHLCCLQLGVIRRAMKLWSKEGDTVLSPFMGIGSEGYVALQMGRKFIGAELKESYYKQAVANLLSAQDDQVPLFAQKHLEKEIAL